MPPEEEKWLSWPHNCSSPENWWQFGRILPSEEHFFLMNSITLWCFQGNEHNNQITKGFFLSAAFFSIERRPCTRQVDAPPMVRDSLSLPPSLPLPPSLLRPIRNYRMVLVDDTIPENTCIFSFPKSQPYKKLISCWQ